MNKKIYKSLLTAGLLAGTTGLMADGYKWDEFYVSGDAEALDIKLNYADLEATVVSANDVTIEMTDSNWEFNNDNRLFWKQKISMCHNSLIHSGLNGMILKVYVHDEHLVEATAEGTPGTAKELDNVCKDNGTLGDDNMSLNITSGGLTFANPNLHQDCVDALQDAKEDLADGTLTQVQYTERIKQTNTGIFDKLILDAAPGTAAVHQMATSVDDPYTELFELREEDGQSQEQRLVALSLEDMAYNDARYDDKLFEGRDHVQKRDKSSVTVVNGNATDVDGKHDDDSLNNSFVFDEIITDVRPMSNTASDCAELNIGISDNKVVDGAGPGKLSNERAREDAQIRLYLITKGIEIDEDITNEGEVEFDEFNFDGGPSEQDPEGIDPNGSNAD